MVNPLVTDLVEEAVELANQWDRVTDAGLTSAERDSVNQLGALVSSPEGLDLALDFVDRVARPEDKAVAAKELAKLSAGSAGFLSGMDKALLGLGASVARLAPSLVVPAARMRLRQLVGHLVVDSRDPALANHLAKSREDGFTLNINLLGEAVLGEKEAASRTERTRKLLERDDVDYVSIKVSSLVSQISTWDFEGTLERVLERLRPLYRCANDRSPHAFVNLDMEEYRDLDITVAVFKKILSEPEFKNLEAGIVLQAYLPDSLGAFHELNEFAAQRVADGGAGIKIRFVKGANLSMERVEAKLHDWELAPYRNKDYVDANYLRLVDLALRSENAAHLRIGVASHNLYAVALAHLLATRRGVTEMLDVEMLQGMAPSQARTIRDTVGEVLLYTPVVAPDDFDVAVSYLVRRLEENAQPQNFMRAMFSPDGDAFASMEDQEARFRRSVAAIETAPSARQRTSHREPAPESFQNAIDSDPALADVREAAREAVKAPPAEVTAAWLRSEDDVNKAVQTAGEAHEKWMALPWQERAAIIRATADQLEKRRWALVTQEVHEGGKTVDQSDPEITEAVDFARYYADRVAELQPGASLASDGDRFTPCRVTLVTPPWNFPVAIPIGGCLAALAAGSAVIAKPSPQVVGCLQIAAEAFHEACVEAGFAHGEDVLRVVQLDEAECGKHLVAHPDVETVILTGGIDTARMFKQWRAHHARGPRVLAETSGKNSLIITPAADYDLAVNDLVKSAFGHAGQKCSAASLVILVGSAGKSQRLMDQLIDATQSVRVGWPTDLSSTMGPVIEAPTGKLLRGLTELEPGEKWLVEPRQLDETGRLWSPGLRDGVKPGSYFHLTEFFGPILGIMRARTLTEAIEMQNAVEFGLTGGIHSLDDGEVETWEQTVEAGNCYVNRHITGAIVQRQSFGGWKNSAVGPGAKAGGPNYVAQLGRWEAGEMPSVQEETAGSIREALDAYTGFITSQEERSWLRNAVESDSAAWNQNLGLEHDPSDLRVETNVFRYLPAQNYVIRVGEGATMLEMVRVLMAAERTGAMGRVSLAPGVSKILKDMEWVGESARTALRRLTPRVEKVETTRQFIDRISAEGRGVRVRALGLERDDLREALAAYDVNVLASDITPNGYRELLCSLQEQSISRTRHRFGHLPGQVE